MQSPMRICPASCKEQNVHRPTADPALFLVARDALAHALATSGLAPKATGISETLGIVSMSRERPNHRSTWFLQPKPTTETRLCRSKSLVKRGKPTNKAQMGTETVESVQVPPSTPRASSPSGLVRRSPDLRAETQDIPPQRNNSLSHTATSSNPAICEADERIRSKSGMKEKYPSPPIAP